MIFYVCIRELKPTKSELHISGVHAVYIWKLIGLSFSYVLDYYVSELKPTKSELQFNDERAILISIYL